MGCESLQRQERSVIKPRHLGSIPALEPRIPGFFSLPWFGRGARIQQRWQETKMSGFFPAMWEGNHV